MDGFDGAGRPQFALGALLGAGTFGEVYLARMTSPNGIQQDVAVKLLNTGLHPRSQPVSRMRDEGHLLASLNHPAILAVKDFCVVDGRIGLVTEFVAGADLHDLIFDSEDPIPAKPVLQVVSALADALHVAWETPAPGGGPMALVHRDVKPVNVRVTPHGSVKLLDFGIAKSDDERRETATVERTAIGTPPYMAPEVHTYEVLDALPSRDVYALGATLFESLARELFFEGLDPKAIVRLCNQKSRYQEWLSQRLPRIASQDPRVVALVARMLRYEHEQRPSAREVADVSAELAEKLSGPTLRAWCQQHRWPPVGGKAGPWSGRQVADEGFGTALVSGRQPALGSGGHAATSSPTLAPHPGAAQATMAGFADDPRPSAPTLAPIGGTIVVPAPTQVGEPPPAAPGRSIVGPIVGLVAALVMIAAGWVIVMEPKVILALLRGDVDEASDRALASVGAVGSLAGGAWGDAAPADVGVDATPLLASGRQWGALPGADEGDLAELRLGAAADVIVVRGGQVPLALAHDGTSVLVPPGPVQVRARFAPIGAHGPQLDLDVAAGDRVTVVCDARAEVCVRR